MIMRSLPENDNIVKLYEVYEAALYFYIVMELASG